MILDGYGQGAPGPGNAVTLAKRPNLTRLMSRYPTAYLSCSGLDVGLPRGQMGNSEVGHTNLGAGRIVYQELTRISKAIEDGSFFENPAFLSALDNCRKNNSTLHVMGLLSDGGVHSHITHFYAMLELARRNQVPVAFHCFMDGRDTPPDSGKGYIEALEQEIDRQHWGRIATVSGRYYAMDRELHWDRIKLAYDAIVSCKGQATLSAGTAMQSAYDKGTTDEFVLPTVVAGGCPLTHQDSVVFMNFRPDRARQMTRALVDPDFSDFDLNGPALCPFYVCMAQYDAKMPNVTLAYHPQSMDNTFGEWISKEGMTQLRIAEYTKYAHVTFFFNAGTEAVYPGEDRVLIDSPQVATYDMQPEMSAFLVAQECVKRIESGNYNVIILNFANCDMVGHTGVLEAAVKAVEAVDSCVGLVVEAIQKADGIALITADHGNAEKMLDDEGRPFTAHTTNQVPIILCKDEYALHDGALCDVAPTMLELLGLEKPLEMTGKSLIDQRSNRNGEEGK